MRPIRRRSGTTPTERYLAKLADSTFLNLWSYPNPYYNKLTAKNGTGKELCDLLVVCGDDVLIFSDKHVAATSAEIQVSWPRWYRKAIEKSRDQIRGAARWLSEFPDRIFLDEACTEPFPLNLPPPESRRIHAIVIARGAEALCEKHTPSGKANLPLLPHINGSEHLQLADGPLGLRFGIGDINPGGFYIHVFDDRGISLAMRELNTVADFTGYLQKRATFLRSGKIAAAASEQELLNHYLRHLNEAGEHDFTHPAGGQLENGQKLILIDGGYDQLLSRDLYRNRRAADRISYAWDALINEFTKNLIAGTSVSLFGETQAVRDLELGVRIMAQEPRVNRRMLGGALLGLLKRSKEMDEDKVCRIVLPGLIRPERGVAYAFLTVKYPKLDLAGGYDQYRKIRANILEAYCMNIFHDNRSLKYVIGIAMDGFTGTLGRSEDMVVMGKPNWTPSFVKEVLRRRKHYDIMRSENLKWSHVEADEYPEKASEHLTRQQRRARERELKKAQKRQS